MANHSVPPLPENESDRLRALDRYAILDTLAEQSYDDITELAAHIAGTPIALISLVDKDRQWFKSKVGLDATETPRDLAFCAHTILNPYANFIVPNAMDDERFQNNPLVTDDPNIRFYFGAPLLTPDQFALGSLCVIDRVPRELSTAQAEALTALSRQVMLLLELRSCTDDLRHAATTHKVYLDILADRQTKLAQAWADLNRHSKIDAVTRLPNRQAFDERLAEEIARAEYFQSTLSLLRIDIDEFDQFAKTNQQHIIKDVLQSVVTAMHCVQSSDYAARYGDGSFSIIMPSTRLEAAQSIVGQIRFALRNSELMRQKLTIRIGASSITRYPYDGAQLIAEAVQAMK